MISSPIFNYGDHESVSLVENKTKNIRKLIIENYDSFSQKNYQTVKIAYILITNFYKAGAVLKNVLIGDMVIISNYVWNHHNRLFFKSF